MLGGLRARDGPKSTEAGGYFGRHSSDTSGEEGLQGCHLDRSGSKGCITWREVSCTRRNSPWRGGQHCRKMRAMSWNLDQPKAQTNNQCTRNIPHLSSGPIPHSAELAPGSNPHPIKRSLPRLESPPIPPGRNGGQLGYTTDAMPRAIRPTAKYTPGKLTRGAASRPPFDRSAGGR